MNTIAIILLVIVAVGCAYAEDTGAKKELVIPQVKVDLNPGPGRDKVETLCGICHSVDYITMQPKGSKTQWTASVTKMIKVFGAPIKDADADVIIRYLAEQYGVKK